MNLRKYSNRKCTPVIKPRVAKSGASRKVKKYSAKIQGNLITENMEEKLNLNMDTLIHTVHPFEAKANQDIDYFVEQFEELAKAAKIPDALKLVMLKSKLLGNAKNILINEPDLRTEQDYENFKVKLIQIFKTDKSFPEAQDEFSRIKQMPTQKVDDFARKFNMVAHRYLSYSGHADKNGAKDFLNTIKLTKFVEALRPDIAFEVQKNGPDSYEEALKIAKKIEIALNTAKHELNSLKTEQDNAVFDALAKFSKEQDETIKDLKEQINLLKISNPNQASQTDKEQRYCHICEKSNHTTRTCFYNKKNISEGNYQNPKSHNYRNQTNNYIPRQFENISQQNNQASISGWNFYQNPNTFNSVSDFQNSGHQNFIPHAQNNPGYSQDFRYSVPQNGFIPQNIQQSTTDNPNNVQRLHTLPPSSQPTITYPRERNNRGRNNYRGRNRNLRNNLN